jgi:hypothetical protein
MKTHNFVYNYGFLADWVKANPQILRKDLLESLGIYDYGTLGKWIDGITMMPLAQMMKFCNAWNVPITAFFFDEQADENDVCAPITPESQIEPNGGWPDPNRKNGPKVCDPRTTVHQNSKLPNYVRTAKTRRSASNDAHTAENETAAKTQTEIPSMERMRYLDIIEKQNERMMNLVNEINDLHRQLQKKYYVHYEQDTSVLPMVAENDSME